MMQEAGRFMVQSAVQTEQPGFTLAADPVVNTIRFSDGAVALLCLKVAQLITLESIVAAALRSSCSKRLICLASACCRHCRWGEGGLEYDQNAPRQVLVDWLEKAGGCYLFDFPTKGILAEAVRNKQYWRLIDHEQRMPGLAGYWPSRSVTFIDNHDTGVSAAGNECCNLPYAY